MYKSSLDNNCLSMTSLKFIISPQFITQDLLCVLHRNYLDSMAEEVNDKLQDKGYLTMVDITKQYDLPADFVSSVSLTYYTCQ